MNQTQKHTTGKKLLALLLALIMSVSLLPMSVFAADLGTEAPIVEGQTQQDAALDESSGEEEIVDSQEPVAEDPAPVEEDTTEDDVDTLAMEGDVAVQAAADLTFTTENGYSYVALTNKDTSALPTTDSSKPYRAVMLDCGRKYFSVSQIKTLIDTMAQYGYNQLQLSFGNGGCRFLLDTMNLTYVDSKLTSDYVRKQIIAGNGVFNGDESYLTQSEMTGIISYANSRGIEIVPMLNMPGHSKAIDYAISGQKDDSLDTTNESVRKFAFALLKKYVDYFKDQGCRYFHFGSDESGETGANMSTFLASCANIIANAGMRPRAFNDETKLGTAALPNFVQITFWVQYHVSNNSKTASALAGTYQLINTHGRWYYVVGSGTAESGKSVQYTSGVSVELPMTKKTGLNLWPSSERTYFDAYSSNVSGDSHKGTMFCIWCDNSTGMPSSDIISDNTTYGALYQIQELANLYWPDDIGTTAPVVKQEDGTDVPSAITIPQGSTSSAITLKADKSVTWTTSDEKVIKLESADTVAAQSAEIIATSVKAIAVGAGTATITATSGGKTASYAITVQDAAAATTKNVTLKVGESKTFTVTGTVSAGEQITDNNKYIATANVTVGTAQVASISKITSVDQISADKKYVISKVPRTNGQSTNLVLTPQSSGNVLQLSGTASPSSPSWKITPNGNGYTVQVVSNDTNNGKYLTIDRNAASVQEANLGLLYLEYTNGAWTIGNGTRKNNNTDEYLNQLGGSDAAVAGGWDYYYGTSVDEGNLWYIQELTEASDGGNSLTITGTGEGNTEVTVDNVTYHITVTAPETTETKALSYGTSFTLPTGATAEITSGSGVTIENGKVVAGNADATAVVTAVVKNVGDKVTARYIYNVTVAAVDFSKIDPLSVELWITNSYIGETSSPTSLQYHSITAQEAYGETGAALGDLVVSPAYRSNDTLQRYYYWKGVVLHDGLKQEVGKDSRVYAGDDFTQIRWNGAWQYLYDGEWKTIVSTDTVIAYYLQKFEVSPEINTYTRDFGQNPNGEQTPNWGGDYDGFSGVAFAVVYPDGTISRSEETMYKTCEVLYSNQNGGTSAGIIWAENNSNYAISKITATRGTHTVEYPGTGVGYGAWTQNGEITWEKVTTDAGKQWYDEVTVWNKDSGTEPVVSFDDLEVDGKNFILKKDQALLVLIYLEVEYSPNNLNLVYWDEAAGKRINPKDIQIVVPEDVTYINGLKNVPNPTVGVIDLPDDAYIVNSDNVSQTINKDITVIDGVAANYKSGIYKYVRAEISADGMTLTLYYNLKEVASEHQFVVDFGLPVNFTGLLSWFNLNNSDTVNYLSVATGYKLTVSTGSWGSIKIDESTWDSMTYTLDKMLSAAATIPLYCNLDDSSQFETRIKVIPASTVYYEDSFAKLNNGVGAAAGATWSTDGTTSEANQKLQELGSKEVYGYDEAYENSTKFSMGSAQKVTVTADMAADWETNANSAWPTATFTFKGTGFDVISLTDNTSGAIFVDVYKGKDTTGTRVKSHIVDNYYGYKQVDGKWVVDETSEDCLYQIPVMKITGLDYGEYTAVITAFYDGAFDHTQAGNSYSFWLDAIRVYDPMGKDYADYTQDQEGYPQYIKLRDALADETNTDVTSAAVFIDGADQAAVSLYKNYGPNNEVYLANGQAISFQVPADQVASVQIGAKAPQGNALLTVSNAVLDTKKTNGTISTATEMYYELVGATGKTVTITNMGTGILSLTNLKITFTTKQNSTVTLAALSDEEQANAVAAVRALFAAPVEPDPEPVVFEPEYFQATWNRSTVKVGQKATLTVKTSADVETVTVNGQDIGNYRVRTERTGWGWNAKKVTYHVFTFTVTATETGTLDYSVVAANAEGVNSEAITATLTVQAADQRPGFGGWLDKIFSRWF